MVNRKRDFFYLLVAISYSLPLPALAEQNHLFALLERMERSYEPVRDYTAVFRKRERVDGELRPEETIFLMFQKPFKFYMRWLAGPNEGREALYVQGANEGKVLIYEPRGLARFFTFLIDPGGWRVLKESRFPFTEIGIGRMIETIGKDARRAWIAGELRLVDHGRESIQGRKVRHVEGVILRDSKSDYAFRRVALAIDEEYGLPVKAALYDRDNRLEGEYSYGELRLNPGLKEGDFDPSNASYHFPRWRVSPE